MATFNINPVRRNPAVKKAWDRGWYVDGTGNKWLRGLDGWFADIGTDRHLIYHHEMASVIEKENPE